MRDFYDGHPYPFANEVLLDQKHDDHDKTQVDDQVVPRTASHIHQTSVAPIDSQLSRQDDGFANFDHGLSRELDKAKLLNDDMVVVEEESPHPMSVDLRFRQGDTGSFVLKNSETLHPFANEASLDIEMTYDDDAAQVKNQIVHPRTAPHIVQESLNPTSVDSQFRQEDDGGFCA